MPARLAGAAERCDDPRAGTLTGYRHHMTKRKNDKTHLPCQACRNASADAKYRYINKRIMNGSRPRGGPDGKPGRSTYLGGHISIDATGTRRRLQALGIMGYGWQAISARTGLAANNLGEVAQGKITRLRSNTVEKIKALYDELSMVHPENTRGAKMIRNRFAKRGWAPPLCWDEESIENPEAWPQGWNIIKTRKWIVHHGTPAMREAFDSIYGPRPR